MGRPSDFTQEKADDICSWLAEGHSLRGYCEKPGAPDMTTIMRWLRLEEGFSKQYARAKEESADALADDILHIADTAKDANLGRLRVDSRKWIASKLKPKKYGDKLDVVSDGEKINQVLVKFIDGKQNSDGNTGGV